MENDNFGHRVKQGAKKFLRWIIGLGLTVCVVWFAFLYWGVSESGLMAGKVVRISEKGVLFKTYEGKFNLETFGALKGVSPVAESFDFSVEKKDTLVISELEAVALTGERVNLHYIKRFGAFPWRGDTRYFATRVERTKN